MYIHKLSPPEHNGQRLLIAALGPRVLEQNALMDAVPWEQLPTHELSKRWFENYWLPLCEHMFIDPYARPWLFDSLDYYHFFRKEWEANNQEADAKYDYKPDEELRQQLIAAPWTAEDHPHVARWVEERSPVLDLFGMAVRKPNFASWRPRPELGNIYMILLPDVQANRAFGRELSIRVTERLGRGDVDGAWYDVMSMFYLSRNHYTHDPIIVTNLVGFAVEGMGRESAKVVLQHGSLTPEQLERFAHDLDSLPRKTALQTEFERYMIFAGLQMLQNRDFAIFEPCCGGGSVPITDLTSFFLYLFGGDGDSFRNDYIPRYLTFLPLDRNIAGKRVAEILQTQRRVSGNSAWNVNRIVSRKYDADFDNVLMEKARQARSPWSFLRVPLIRTRSELVADYVASTLFPALGAANYAHCRTNTHLELLRLSVALERYKAANGEYPETLDALIPKYLVEVPLEPLTGRQSFVYQRSPDAETAFLLHSSEWDENDGSRTRELFVRRGKR